MSRVTDDIVMAAVIAHDLGAPLLKVPVPDAPPGQGAADAVGAGGGQRGGPRAVPRRAPPTGRGRRVWPTRPATSWTAVAPGWPWAGPSSRSRPPRRRRHSWLRSCTPGDPHPGLRHECHQGGAVGTGRAGGLVGVRRRDVAPTAGLVRTGSGGVVAGTGGRLRRRPGPGPPRPLPPWTWWGAPARVRRWWWSTPTAGPWVRAILWSDRRAVAEGQRLTSALAVPGPSRGRHRGTTRRGLRWRPSWRGCRPTSRRGRRRRAGCSLPGT